jgi:hypothetical protein
MSITIFSSASQEAMESGFYPVTVTFKDESSNAIAPDADSISWTLTDNGGSVINSRLNATEASATAITIELQDNDLAIQGDEMSPIVRRRLCIKWTYASTYGAAKPGRAELIFQLRNLTRIPSTAT